MDVVAAAATTTNENFRKRFETDSSESWTERIDFKFIEKIYFKPKLREKVIDIFGKNVIRLRNVAF